jgi:hypothetical protein
MLNSWKRTLQKVLRTWYISADICKKIRIVHNDFPHNNVDTPTVNAAITENNKHLSQHPTAPTPTVQNNQQILHVQNHRLDHNN